MAVKIQLRRGLAATWTLDNPLLADGEFGIESDTKRFKLGDGVNFWNTLPYGGPVGITPTTLITELGFDDAYPSFYSELSYDVNGVIQQVDSWDTSAKAIHLFSKAFVYTSGKISGVTITRIQTGSKIVKSITYTNGKVSAVTRVFTP